VNNRPSFRVTLRFELDDPSQVEALRRLASEIGLEGCSRWLISDHDLRMLLVHSLRALVGGSNERPARSWE
jgi:hypothetical protein